MAKIAGASQATRRSYVGVYMAWRGESVRGFLDNTTFWNRRDTAQAVGSSDFAEAIYRVMGATKLNSPNSRIVVVGHSFGALCAGDGADEYFREFTGASARCGRTVEAGRHSFACGFDLVCELRERQHADEVDDRVDEADEVYG